jgi:D-arabinose 5-phosphate isomerase GutQ
MIVSVSPDKIISSARSVINRDSRAVSSLTDQISLSFVDAVNAILNCTGHVLVTGTGTSNSTATRFAHLLSCCGTPALFIHPGDSQHGLSGAVTSQDVLVAISKGGETDEVNYLARTAKNRRAKVISLTRQGTTLAMLSDIVVPVQTPDDGDPFDMIATCSSLTLAALCDALCETLLIARGYREESFWETHPGGNVGKKIALKRSDEATDG